MADSGVFPKTGGSTDLIYKGDYNTLQTAVAAVKTTYYGVACTSSQLGSGLLNPSIAEWNNLKSDIDNCYTHITGSDSAVTTKFSNTVVSAVGTNAYKTAADYINTNKATVFASSQLTLVSAAGSSRTSGWNSAITHQARVTFASSSDATYFFNCGGYFRIQTAASGGSGGTKNTNWASAINSVGNWVYTSADYGANKSNNYAVSAYSSSSLTISCTYESATSLLFTMYFNDATGGNPDEVIDLSISTDLSYYKSTGGITSPFPNSVTNITTLDGSGGILTPSYSVAAAGSTVNEGSSLTFDVTTSNVSNGTTLYWTVTNAGDFGTSSGSFTISSNAGSFSVTPTADSTTEGSETFSVNIRTGSTSGTVVASSSNITIADTSTTPVVATYGFGTIPTSINEGSTGAFNVITTNVANGTTLYWTAESNAGDFGTSSGSFTITGNAGIFYLTPTADATTEGSETFTVAVRTGSTGGTIVATSNSVTINDTSLTPTYSLYLPYTSVNEGSSTPVVAQTTNVANGTVLYWTISNGTTSNADFSATSGSVTINSGSGQIDITAVADSTTEGSQTFTVQLRTGSTSGSVVATSGTITINDTSVSAAAAILTNYIDSNYNAGLEATFIQAYTQLAFLTTGTSRTAIGNSGTPETRSILPGEWLTTSPTAVSTTTAGLFDIELTPSSATLAIDGDNTVFGARTYSTGSSWNTRIQLGNDEVFRYLLVDIENDLGGSASHDATAIFTATIYLHGTNTVQTSTAITMYSRAGTVEL